MISYKKPKVLLLTDTGIGNSEFAARCCYNSFQNTDNPEVKYLADISDKVDNGANALKIARDQLFDVEESKLLEQLVWVNFHESVVEHSVFTFYIKNISRGVLQELVRHRLASYSVKSTRYTLSHLLYIFLASIKFNEYEFFKDEVTKSNIFIVNGEALEVEIKSLWLKLCIYLNEYNMEELAKLILSKDNLQYFINNAIEEDPITVLHRLKKGKAKRNVGDEFKWIVTDTFTTELVMTINLRSLKNFIKLRKSDSAYFQIKWLAEGMLASLPKKYKRLISKRD